MNNRIIFHSPIRYIVAFIIAAIITILYLSNTTFQVLRAYADGMVTGGVVTIFIGLLVLLSNLGAFDMFSYAFSRVSRSNRERYHDLYEYSEDKRIKRSSNRYVFMPYLVVGALFILVSIILFIIA